MRANERAISAKPRDVFDWLGVVVDIVQAVVFAAGAIAALYWFVLRGGGMPAVVVGLAIAVVALLCCAVGVLLTFRYSRTQGHVTGRERRNKQRKK